jgi:hypothetical protein
MSRFGNYRYFLFLMASCSSLFATEAMVTVLRAPLFKERSFDSTIVQYLSRGEKIFLHQQDVGPYAFEDSYSTLRFEKSTLHETVLSQAPDDGETTIMNLDRVSDIEGYIDRLIEVDSGDGRLHFLQTIDRRGAKAYVAKEHVKIIYGDDREKRAPVSSLPTDYTDYRLSEPLPDGYPIHTHDRYRLQMLTGGGAQRKVSYNYNSTVVREELSLRTGLTAHFQKGLDYDKSKRYFFGAIMHIFSSQGDFKLANDTFAQELKLDIGFGPTISYDVFRQDIFRLTFYGGFSFVYSQAFISQQLATGSNEERSFWDITVVPRIGQIMQAREIFGKIDLVLVGDFAFHLPHSLEGGKKPVLPSAWNEGESDQINYSAGGELTLMFGVQTNY